MISQILFTTWGRATGESYITETQSLMEAKA